MNATNRYVRCKFHDDPDINYRIQILLTYYDLEVQQYKLPYIKQIKLINSHIKSFVQFQEFEAAVVFRKRKFELYKKYRRGNRKLTIKFMLRYLKFKLKGWWRRNIVMTVDPDLDI